MENKNYIDKILLDETGLPAPSSEIRHERDLALYDILQDNEFSLNAREDKDLPNGPFTLTLGIKNSLLVFVIQNEFSSKQYEIHISLGSLKPIIQDYFEICKSYFNAVKRLPPSQIETIDMGRRGIHLEGSRALIERLSGKVNTNVSTAKRLFTLICALHST